MKEFTFAGTVSVPGFVQKVLRKPIVESPRVCLMK